MSIRMIECSHCLNDVKYGASICTGCKAEIKYGPPTSARVIAFILSYIVVGFILKIILNIATAIGMIKATTEMGAFEVIVLIITIGLTFVLYHFLNKKYLRKIYKNHVSFTRRIRN